MKTIVEKNVARVESIPFYGEELRAAQDDTGKVWVSIWHLCGALNMAHAEKKQQLAWIEENFNDVAAVVHCSDDSYPEGLECLGIDALSDWLDTLTPTPGMVDYYGSASEAQKTINLYCSGALWEITDAFEEPPTVEKKETQSANKLTVFSSDVIPVYTTDTGEKVVIGRELHEKLKIDDKYTQWFDRMCGYGFEEGTDYTPFWEANGSDPIFGNAHFKSPQQAAALGYQRNHLLKLDMAKHIAMIQRSPQGKAIRDKLIALETNISQLSPELRTLINLEVQQRQQAKMLAETNRRLDSIGDVIALNPNSWREDTRSLIVKIAQKLGGNEYIRDVQAEIHHLVDERAGVLLETRLTNKRRRMAEEGVCKSKRDRLTKVDVISDDKKLIEIYLAVVKEMAIKYGIDK